MFRIKKKGKKKSQALLNKKELRKKELGPFDFLKNLLP